LALEEELNQSRKEVTTLQREKESMKSEMVKQLKIAS
jgi:hypothetical protein